MSAQLDFAERVEDDPWGLIAEALLYETKHEAVPDDLQDAVMQAAMLLTSVALMRAGATKKQIEKLMIDRDWSTRISYNFETSEFGCEINWQDGDEQLVVNGKPKEPARESSTGSQSAKSENRDASPTEAG